MLLPCHLFQFDFAPSNVCSPKLSLQVLAERYRHKYPTGSAYVSAFEARPMLHVKPERHKRFTDLNFVEAVREDPNPTVEELIPAYRVAGDGFVGKMKSLFIMEHLTERHVWHYPQIIN